MTELSVDRVSVHYGSTPALDRFSLAVASGEVVAVLGPSGSGKSTLLRAVAGLEPLTAGRIVLDGRDLAGVPTHRRGLGLMFQDHGLFAHLSVADNIAYGLRTAGASKQVQRARVGELLDLVGLTGFESRRTSELSGGEAQRVALARALAPEPGLMMLDEPLGSLDRALRDQLTGDLRRLLTGLGQTALHVTHDQAEAFAVADRVVIVSAGRPVAIGSPAELWGDPGSRFVAEFLGHANICTVSVDDGGAVDLAGHRLGTLAADHPVRALGPGERLVVLPATAIDPVATLDGPSLRAPAIEAPAIEVVATEVVFRRGLYDVTAGVERPGHDVPGGTLRFSTAQPVTVGRRLTVTIDSTALRPLTDD
ncbi:MAG: ABC transporter ATP-binding protein [Acidimicrobiales bacterium]